VKIQHSSASLSSSADLDAPQLVLGGSKEEVPRKPSINASAQGKVDFEKPVEIESYSSSAYVPARRTGTSAQVVRPPVCTLIFPSLKFD
jgi:hypothetical protein